MAAINRLLENVLERLKDEQVVRHQFADLAAVIPEADDSYELEPSTVRFISESLTSHELDSEPRIRRGLVKRALDSPIIMYKSDGLKSSDSNAYKNALLLVRMAVLMAKVDGQASEEELETIKALIWNLGYLVPSQKCALYAKAMYLMDSGQKYDVRARDYVRLVLNRESIVSSLENISPTAANTMIEVAKAIAIADGFVDRSELVLLQDLYKVQGKSARSTKADLDRYAREQFVEIKQRDESTFVSNDELHEAEDILGDILLDFDD